MACRYSMFLRHVCVCVYIRAAQYILSAFISQRVHLQQSHCRMCNVETGLYFTFDDSSSEYCSTVLKTTKQYLCIIQSHIK